MSRVSLSLSRQVAGHRWRGARLVVALGMIAANLRRRGRAPIALVAALVAAVLVASGPAQAAVINGTPGADFLDGTPGPDLIRGGAGDDRIDGGEGDDVLIGGPGRDKIFAGGDNDLIDARDGEQDIVRCDGAGEVVVGVNPIDVIPDCDGERIVVGPGDLRAATAQPPRFGAPLHVVYDFAPEAQTLHASAPGLPGLGTVRTAARQYPLGDPFPNDRWIGKVGHGELQALSPNAIASLLERRLRRYTFGPELGADLVAIDEIGVQAQDDGFGPRLLAAMQMLARRRHQPTGEPLSRRVIMYAAPKFVGNVGEPNDRELWDSTLAAARLSGGVYLQMYHGQAGRVTGAATQAEWRDYLPRWQRELGSPRLLRVVITGVGPAQEVQWTWARATPAGRAALRSGVGAYRLGSRDTALAWLRNWNRHAR